MSESVSRKEELAQSLADARAKTLWLLDQVPDEFLRRRVHSFYSPIGWHFGHVGRTEEYWIGCRAMTWAPVDARLTFLYADLPDNPKDNRVHIPERADTINYLSLTREVALRALEKADLGDLADPFLADGYAWEFAIQHEYQHQETIAEMLCLIHKALGPRELEPIAWKSERLAKMLPIPGGGFHMGSDDRHGYDNEKRAHEIRVDSFGLAETPVTAFQWTEFMDDGGYDREELWSNEGWSWKVREGVERPEYWLRADDGHFVFGPTGVRAIHPDEPASCLSWFEAEAFANWSGKRLPTEQEWEFSARFDPASRSTRRHPWGNERPNSRRARFAMEGFAASPVGQHGEGCSPAGVHDLAGNAWEWTSSAFLPYPGFEAFPYDGYSKDHMEGEHRSCRGGSWATSATILRSSFRNWYVPSYRQGFLGVRLAESEGGC